MPQTRKEILKLSLDARVEEIMHYQINIDNYTLALQKIGTLPEKERIELFSFSEQLSALLSSEKIEQKKSQIMLEVLQQQTDKDH